MTASQGLPAWFWYAIVPLVIAQLSLQVWGIVDLMKRDTGPLRGMKLVWLLVILLGEMLGVLLYFAIGRGTVGQAPAAEQGAAPSAEQARSAVDSLYGQEPPDAGR